MRTNSDMVAAVLMDDYDGKSSLLPFIRSANNMTNRAQSLAIVRKMNLTTAELLDIETWLAAHFYCCSDQPLQQKTTQSASGTFQGKTEDGLCGTKYGQTAVRLDWSGSLNAIDKRLIAKGAWLGSIPTGEPPADPGAGLVPY